MLFIKPSLIFRTISLYIILVLFILIFSFFLNYFEANPCSANSLILEKQLLSLAEKSDIIKLSDITSFKWDKAYSFSPYTTKETIYETIGSQCNSINESISEGMNHLVFLKNGEVVSYLYGYPDEIGYYISFDSSFYKDGVGVISYDEDIKFKISIKNDILNLTHINN
ncbi:hypothetical protein [Clostridium septicum]|uniref:Uncharacterized protein n=1 Tax=Clostridium septicum TaxID=1504 RepID=A0A9N7JL16_CLOSE|nr:hypothetical protein [Clostridium septicum]AYE34014.1 hypothetical protein CP523_05800 [Clostridium septicum]MDU1314545.1 hypothetical protein [Clostridium septicum]QAS59386.1 hypothetical protein EI377_00285 [Clostridium septicum]UEC21363.1 hypothetical protein LK444_03025 [Clostridium septicum]USS00592.1 hypothetical protein NH397_14075 [Clostridium septicum]